MAVYICLFHKLSTVTEVQFQNIQVLENPTPDSNIIEQVKAQILTLHYPKPETFSRGECTKNPVRFFAILSMQRSGSGWFETLLNSHINISSNGEIFFPVDRRKNISTIIQTLDRVYSLDWFNSASKNECSAAVGFKWMLNQGLMEHHKEIVQHFNHRGVAVVFLFRRNSLQRMVSLLANSYDRYAKLLNGTHKSHVHSQEEATALSRYKPIINSTSLISDLKEVEMDAVQAIKYFKSTRHMKLEDVQEFLGLPKMELTSRQVKIHKGPLSDFVKNWDDVFTRDISELKIFAAMKSMMMITMLATLR
ncbi:P-loop containing nucleoside triphosphate hydrolases superfamily protein isoform 4 [Hibiscus syriacus]|uniref:P-loop containing nucleoside triphosphate hydrolases superfamily protein isoform 4 n=1 Tax=Hibiscus syriacus TaxID=106335 RepID=A0A6A2YFU8_HIBSY|nr:P-loop containing nucleoside triphosphate hydrolases superfamily protein isoform 4 [Hibiscus syriacus]